ncbi:Rho termination protein [Desulfocarbo indianensis]|nr:Rho termination protein [Desulfocarbo indianensis]
MAEKQVKEKPLEKMTAKELREMALGIEGILGVHSMNKPELIAAIKEAKGIVDGGGKKADPAAIRAAKKKIKEIRAKREELGEDADKKQLSMMRRRISRLKKKTRALAG